MKVVVPLELSADVDASTVAEPHADEAAYNAATVYVDGDTVIDATNHLAYESLIGTAATVTISNGGGTNPGVVTWTTHGLAANDPIIFTTTGTLPTGLTAGVIYYVLAPALNTFTVAASPGGTAINTNSAGSGTHTGTANPNVGYALTDLTAWAAAGSTNKFSMFDLDNNTTTYDNDEIIATVSPNNVRADAVGIMGMDADTLYVQTLGDTASRNNDMGKSEDFSTTWTKTALTGVTADDARGPFYTLAADLIIPNTSSTTHHVSQTQTSSSGDKCLSVYVKAEGYDGLRAYISDGTNEIYADFDLTAGTASALTNTGVWTDGAVGIEAAKNGYYRCYVAGTQNAGTTLTCRFYVLDGATATFAGDGVGGVHMFGGMLDRSLTLRPYLANTGTGDVVSTASAITYEYEEDLTTREVVDYWSYFFTEFSYKPSIFLEGLPPSIGSKLTIALIRDGGVASCSAVAYGRAIEIGRDAEYGAASDELNFSTITRDTFGTATLVPRRSVPAAQLTVWTPKERVNIVRSVRTALNAVPALWVGAADSSGHDYFESVMILGIYKRFAIDLAQPNDAKISLDLEGL